MQQAMSRTSSCVTAVVFLGLCFAVAAEPDNLKSIARIAIEAVKGSGAETNGNLMVSPVSLYSVLNNLLPGAGGKTADEIKTLLGSDPNVLQEKLNGVLKEDKGVRIMNSTTRIFYRKGVEINDTFRANAEKNFETGFAEFDPESNVLEQINNWLANSTNMRINQDDISNDSDLFVVNAMSFKCNWEEEFDSQDTTDGDFHQDGTHAANVPFMVKRDAKLVAGINEKLGAKWIQLPYTKEMKMLLVLPVERFHIRDVLDKMKVADLIAMASGGSANATTIAIPMFDIDTSFKAEMLLKKLGVRDIFTSRADLAGISKSIAPLQLGKIVQSCHVRVDEKQTTAEAKTIGSLDFHRGSLPLPTDAFFTADEPFLIFILVGQYPAFAGIVADPKGNN